MKNYVMSGACMFLLAALFGVSGLYLMYLSIPYAVAPVFLGALLAVCGMACLNNALPAVPDPSEQDAPPVENEKIK